MPKINKILCVGPQWRGSNAIAFFKGLSREGILIDVIDEFYYLNLEAKSLKARVASKVFRNLNISEFNKAILNKVKLFNPDLVLVYKGAFVKPQTILSIRNQQILTSVFFPDVSFTNHGNLTPKTLPLYDYHFTTKSFGIDDMKSKLGITGAQLILHGFDPDIHRKLPADKIAEQPQFFCDVSFIGTYSPRKERQLTSLAKALPDCNIKIWGNQWDKCTSKVLKKAIQYQPVVGDLYVMAIQASLINLGLLSEIVVGASSGDLVTSRTFHIPGSNGFMIHADNSQLRSCYKVGQEVAGFTTDEDLCEKVAYYLEKTEERENIRKNGYERAQKDHDIRIRSRKFIEHIENVATLRDSN